MDYETLYNLYINKNMTIKQISETLNINHVEVGKKLKEYRLTRPSGDYKKAHGMSDTRQYGIWKQMKNRCNNPKNINFKNYGGKGINYKDSWETFNGFWQDMKVGYKDDLTLDRINNNENYCKENCRWVDYVSQNNNKKDNVKFPIKELMEKTGLSQNAIYSRVRKGWSEERIINTPKLSNNGSEKVKTIGIERKKYTHTESV